MTPKRTVQFVSFFLAAVFTALSSAAKLPSYKTESFDGNDALPAAQTRAPQTSIPEAKVVPVNHSAWKFWQSHVRILSVDYDDEIGRFIRVTLGEDSRKAGYVLTDNLSHSFHIRLGDMHVDAEFSKKMEFRNANGFDIRQEADYLSPMHNKDKGDSPSESIASLIIDHKASNSHVRIQANGIASEQAEDTGDTIYKTPDGLKIQVRDEHVFQTRFTAVDKNGNTISCSVEDEAQNCRNTITQIRLMKLRSIKDIGRYMNIPVWIKGGTRTP